MTTEQKNAIIRRAMFNAKGDDLERANHAFDRLTKEQLEHEHGQSGKTRLQIWNEYRDHRGNWIEANEYLEKLLK